MPSPLLLPRRLPQKAHRAECQRRRILAPQHVQHDRHPDGNSAGQEPR
jgi:hypothetical protein